MFILSCLYIFFLFSGGSYIDQTKIFSDYNVKNNNNKTVYRPRVKMLFNWVYTV